MSEEETIQEQKLRYDSLYASLHLFSALLESTKVAPKREISEVEVVAVANLFYAYLKGEEAK